MRAMYRLHQCDAADKILKELDPAYMQINHLLTFHSVWAEFIVGISCTDGCKFVGCIMAIIPIGIGPDLLILIYEQYMHIIDLIMALNC